jgi:hypothetical protein
VEFKLRDLPKVTLVAIQLVLALLVIERFQLESRTFFNVMLLGAAGFVLHAILPLRYRLGFFCLLSIAAIGIALGPVDGLFLILLGLALIAICHLPVRMPVRISILLGTAALFAVWRMELLPAPWSAAIWPVLASMFMFRLAIYLYVLSHDPERPTAAQAISYFFMLPNVCFPLYPVVDYSTFIRTYYDRDAGSVYETGMKWIARGLLHLILYRYVYVHLASDPAGLATLGGLVQYLLATFLLYLRISGQFHVITGVLHLFGFGLPETHHLYFLASSFTDFWRRINIYWKDFMMKLVFYPSYFRFRRWNGKIPLIGATLVVFLTTWILHSYQWFWLRGGFPLTAQDILFWGILAALVVFGSLREIRKPGKRAPGRSPVWSATLALRTVGTFAVICVLWSMWSAHSITGWLMMWTVAGNVAPGDLWLLFGLALGGFLIAGRPWSVWETKDNAKRPFYMQPALYSTGLLLAILVIGDVSWYERYSPQLASIVRSLHRSTLNSEDAALQHKGYYENLDNTSRLSAELWDVRTQRPKHWVGLNTTSAYRVRNDFLGGDLRPGVKVSFLDHDLTTNRWGMRDRDCSVAKPAGTYRIALLGPSHVMGSGVADGETFADFLEERLNQGSNGGPQFEVLNFGVAGNTLLGQVFMLEDRALKFHPDAVFVTDSPRLKSAVVGHVLRAISTRTPIPFPGLEAMVRATGAPALAHDGLPVPFDSLRRLLSSVGVQTRMPWDEAQHRLAMAADDIVRWALQHMAGVAEEHNAVPVFLALDNVGDPPAAPVRALEDANTAGFLVLNLLDLWRNRDKGALWLGEWDHHPNAAGNRVIAERLFELIQQHRVDLRIHELRAEARDPSVARAATRATP